MRFALLLPVLAALVGCDEGYSFDRSIADTQNEMVKRARPLDTSKAPPDLPIPKNPPKQIDTQKVLTESAKVTAMKIEEIDTGSGPIVQPGKYVSVHYVGLLPDGYIFDSSYLKNDPQPYTFLYDPTRPEVIQGWIDGLKGMRVGGHRRLVIPPKLAYGANPPPGSPIPPNSALIFEIQLMFVGDTQ